MDQESISIRKSILEDLLFSKYDKERKSNAVLNIVKKVIIEGCKTTSANEFKKIGESKGKYTALSILSSFLCNDFSCLGVSIETLRERESFKT